jgi:uncharacterized DUF497 family protein
MDDRPVVWDQYNRRHLTQDHPERGISLRDVEEAMADPDRIEAAIQRSDGAYRAVIWGTQAGSLLYVAPHFLHQRDIGL